MTNEEKAKLRIHGENRVGIPIGRCEGEVFWELFLLGVPVITAFSFIDNDFSL